MGIVFPLVEYFADHDSVTSAMTEEIIIMSISTASRYIHKMIDLRLIEKIGVTNNVQYRFVYTGK